jgi:hypothetical protein
MTEFTGDVATNLHNQHLGHLSNHMESLRNTSKDSKDPVSPPVIYGRTSRAVSRDFFTYQPSTAAKKRRPISDMSMQDGSSPRFSIAEIWPHTEETEDLMQQEI